MDDDIFADDLNDIEPTLDETKDYLAELVGDNKKFKDYQGLAKGKYLADQTIEILKRQLDEHRNELKTRMSLDQFMTKMKDSSGRVEDQPVIIPDTQPTNLDAQTLEAKLEELLARREAAKASETNKERVVRVLRDQLGADAPAAVTHKAQQLGMTKQDLHDLSLRSPKAFFEIMGISEEPHQPINTRVAQSQFNSANQKSPAATGAKGQSYYDNLKKSNPTLYWSQDTTIAMMKDAEKLGLEVFKAS